MSQNKIFEGIIGIRTKDDAVLCNHTLHNSNTDLKGLSGLVKDSRFQPIFPKHSNQR